MSGIPLAGIIVGGMAFGTMIGVLCLNNRKKKTDLTTFFFGH